MKRFGAMLRLIIATLVMHAIPAYATTWEDATGPYSTVVVADTGPENTYYIYRPTTLKSNAHPIAVLCIGSGSHPKDYDALLTSLASHGVVAIASTDRYQIDGSKASAGVNWLIDQNEVINSDYYQKLIPSKVLAIGHSVGGNGALLASITNPRITSLLLYAPSLEFTNAPNVLVPTFYISGSLDRDIPPHLIKARYQEAKKANAWYGENANQGHTGFARNPSVQYYSRAWVYTHLFDDPGSARGCFYGPNWTFKNATNWSETLKNNSVL